MNANDTPSRFLDNLPSILAWLAAVILVAGLGSAAWVWHAQDLIDRGTEPDQSFNSATPLPPLDSRKHVRDVEMYYGKLGVLMEQAEELLHGKPLAKTIAIASVLIAAGLFLVAARLRIECPPEPNQTGEQESK